jgi:hypothetical protein
VLTTSAAFPRCAGASKCASGEDSGSEYARRPAPSPAPARQPRVVLRRAEAEAAGGGAGPMTSWTYSRASLPSSAALCGADGKSSGASTRRAKSTASSRRCARTSSMYSCTAARIRAQAQPREARGQRGSEGG